MATEVWRRFGPVENYVEPFCGSAAVLLTAPYRLPVCTLNDIDLMLSNFWRAVLLAPEKVARWADWPVVEADMRARQWWLITEGRGRVERVIGEPDGFDAQVAGWWAWGLCNSIGAAWCTGDGPWAWTPTGWQCTAPTSGRIGIRHKIPHLGGGGGGLGGKGMFRGNPPDRHAFVLEWLRAVSDHFRANNVRVTCGDWSRVCGDTVTWRHGLTGIFFDPNYSAGTRRYGKLYAVDEPTTAKEAAAVALELGKRPDIRVAFCGYEGEHAFPGWDCLAWKAKGGYGSQGAGQGRANAARERIWFSPACRTPD